jgi:hypothetical protein
MNTHSIKALIIMALSRMTFNIMALSVTINITISVMAPISEGEG